MLFCVRFCFILLQSISFVWHACKLLGINLAFQRLILRFVWADLAQPLILG